MHILGTLTTLLCMTAFCMATCPQWPLTKPCFCLHSKDGSFVQCTGPAPEDQVVSTLKEVRMSGPWHLHLENLQLKELPANVRTVSSLRLTRCDIVRLQKITPMVWPRLSEVVFESVQMRNSPWSQLKGAHVLKSIKISDVTPVETNEDTFRSIPPSVEYLDFRRTGTIKFKSGSMAHLKKLIYVFIADMPLSEFPRDTLPQEMPQLHTFILGNTLIDHLESGFFHGMPRLQVLMLNGNRFTSLNPQLLTPLRDHLTHLVAERNPLECDCSLLWLKKNFQSKRNIKVLATCYDTMSNEFKGVMKLNEGEYC